MELTAAGTDRRIESVGVHVVVVQNETASSRNGRDERFTDLDGVAASMLYSCGVTVDGVSPRKVSEADTLRGRVDGRFDPVSLARAKRHLRRRAEDVNPWREDLGVLLARVVPAVDGRHDRVIRRVRNLPGDVGALDETEAITARAR